MYVCWEDSVCVCVGWGVGSVCVCSFKVFVCVVLKIN